MRAWSIKQFRVQQFLLSRFARLRIQIKLFEFKQLCNVYETDDIRLLLMMSLGVLYILDLKFRNSHAFIFAHLG